MHHAHPATAAGRGRPRLTFRVAVVGTRQGLDAELVSGHWRQALTSIEQGLQHVGNAAYGGGKPLVRVVSGLAEGAERLLPRTFLESGSVTAEREIAAVLPFAAGTMERTMADPAAFRSLVSRCAYVMEAGGVYEPGPEAESRSKRTRGYRAKVALLLRQCDLLVVVTTYDDDPGSPGGPKETVRRALQLGIPVFWISASTSEAAFWTRAAQAPQPGDRPREAADCFQSLQAYVQRLTAPQGDDGFAELLYQGAPPAPNLSQRRWSTFEGFFKQPAAKTGADGSARRKGEYQEYFQLADAWAIHYTSLYRGTFLMNFARAAFAVLLAVISMIVLGSVAHPDGALLALLLTLAGLKLWIVLWIQRSTHQANHEGWVHRGVNYRYLAERLRGMEYLPLLGCYRAPEPGMTYYASRYEQQSVMDWLLAALVRQAKPRGELDLVEGLETIRHQWVGEQLGYHRRTAAKYDGMYRSLERLLSIFTNAVIAVVLVDIGLLGLELAHVHVPKAFGLALTGLAAFFPAAMSSLNAIRFHSECEHLADRSAHFARLLEKIYGELGSRCADVQYARSHPAEDVGGHILDVLPVVEDLAGATADEASDWSALYAKTMAES